MTWITYLPEGRLGNQLQLYGCARTLSWRYGWSFLPQPLVNPEALRPTFRPHDWLRLKLVERLVRPVVLDNHDWDDTFNQSGQMRASIRRSRRTLFVLQWGAIFKDLSQYRRRLIDELFAPSLLSRRGVRFNDIGVHIRRDDAEYPLPLEYYVATIERARQAISAARATVHLFSDGNHRQLAADLRSRLPSIDIVIHQNRPVRDLTLLSTYPQLVLSMSWFSYWAAFLSEDARIFAPRDFCYDNHWIPC